MSQHVGVVAFSRGVNIDVFAENIRGEFNLPGVEWLLSACHHQQFRARFSAFGSFECVCLLCRVSVPPWCYVIKHCGGLLTQIEERR